MDDKSLDIVSFCCFSKFWKVIECDGKERLSDCYYYTIVILVDKDDVNLPWQGETAKIIWGDRGLGTQTVHADISGYSHQLRSTEVCYVMTLILEPALKQLFFPIGDTVWQGLDSIQIIKTLLNSYNINHHFLNVSVPTDKRVESESPNESKWIFFKRLLANHGCYFWIEHNLNGESVIIADNKVYQPHIDKCLRYLPLSGQQHDMIAYCNAYGVYDYTINLRKESRKLEVFDVVAQKQLALIASSHLLPTCSASIIHHSNLLDNEHAQRISLYYQQAATCRNKTLVLRTLVLGLYPGAVITVDFGSKEQYQIINIHHVMKNSYYHNEITLIPYHQQYRDYPVNNKRSSNFCSAKVQSAGESLMDTSGRQAIKFSNMQYQHDQYHSCAVLSPYVTSGSKQTLEGLYAPLQLDSDVLIGCQYDDVNRPIVIGSILGRKQGPKIIKKDASWVTHASHQVLLQKAVSLSTRNSSNEVVLNENNGNRLQAFSGDMSFVADKDIAFRARRFSEQLTKGKTVYQSSQNISIKSRYASVSWSSNAFDLDVRSNMTIKAGADLIVTSGRDLVFNANNKVAIKSQDGVAFNIGTGSVSISSSSHLSITAANKDVTIGNSQGGMRFSRNGEFVCWGNMLLLEAQKSLMIQGNIKSGPVHRGKPAFAALPPEPSIISKMIKHQYIQRAYNLRWNEHSVSNQEMVFALFNIENPSPNCRVNVVLYFCESLGNSIPHRAETLESCYERRSRCGEIVALLSEESECQKLAIDSQYFQLDSVRQQNSKSICYYRFGLRVQDEDIGVLSAPLVITINISLRLCNNKPIMLPPDQALSITSVKLKRSGYNTISITPSMRSERVTSNIVSLPNVAMGRQYRLHLIDQEVFVPGKRSPWCFLDFDVSISSRHNQTVSFKVLQPPMIVNVRHQHSHGQILSDSDLMALSKRSNNLCLFVHGYNVPHGDFGKHLDKQSHIYMLEHVATVFRDPPILALEFDEHIETIGKFNTINGSGAHQWITHIEKQLNLGNGFDGLDYEKFNRVALFSWHGDPSSASDFMSAVQYAKVAAKKLYDFILNCQSRQQNLRVSIVSHSLGAAVVTEAMELLATSGHDNSLEHVYLWQPAIPENTLLPQTSDGASTLTMSYYQYVKRTNANNKYREFRRTHPWRLAFAHRAARHITVLYSKNDNILGPIQYQHSSQLILAKKPIAERMIASILDNLGLSSLFDLAMWIGKPIDYFFNSKNRREFYQGWIKQHPRKGALKPFPKTLAQYAKQNSQVVIVPKRELLIQYFIFKLNHRRVSSSFNFKILEKLILDKELKPYLTNNTTYTELRAIYTLLRESNFTPCPALGWSGPDRISLGLLSHKLITVDQSSWLFSHSAMLNPSQAVFNKSYQHGILSSMKFGEDAL